jgi:hypothetical protein
MKKLRMLHSIIYGIITVLLLILMLSVALLDSPVIPISILVSVMLFGSLALAILMHVLELIERKMTVLRKKERLKKYERENICQRYTS